MQEFAYKCFNRVGGSLNCLLCKGYYIKYGKTMAGKQRYKCRGCHKTCIENYTNQSYNISNHTISTLVKEGCGIRSIARLLKISCTTVLKRILVIAKAITKPILSLNKRYEVDEMRTYYKNKGRLLWIVYTLQKETKKVADFVVGRRTKATLQKVITTLCLSNAEKIYTDKLNLYNFLIPARRHSSTKHGTNNIERKNLSVRTHLKRLNRKTICFSKSIAMLCACIKIYFWG
jgi:insertion element IS1 protein InsB